MECLSGLTTLQIGDEDVEFSGKSVAALRFNRLLTSEAPNQVLMLIAIVSDQSHIVSAKS